MLQNYEFCYTPPTVAVYRCPGSSQHSVSSAMLPSSQRHAPSSPSAILLAPQRHAPSAQRHAPSSQRHAPSSQRHAPSAQLPTQRILPPKTTLIEFLLSLCQQIINYVR